MWISICVNIYNFYKFNVSVSENISFYYHFYFIIKEYSSIILRKEYGFIIIFCFIICYMSNKTYRNIKKRIRFVSNCYKFDKYFSSISNYNVFYNIKKYINFYNK